MEVGIIGASAAGLYSAILIKRAHPDFKVSLFERNDRVGKKLAATGNGHCNLLNRKVSFHYFHESPIAKALFEKYPYEVLEDTLKNLGVCLTYQGDLVYPMCYHAPSYVKFLLDTAADLGVEINLSSCLLSYKKKGKRYELGFGDKNVLIDKLVFATGGKSQKKFGSDGSLFTLFEEHGYRVAPLSPSLCPVKIKERVKPMSGLRHKAFVSAFSNGNPIYMEEGEVLFKDDGLSGIAVMNASSYLIREPRGKDLSLCLDLFPTLSANELLKLLSLGLKANPDFFLSTVLEKPILAYIFEFCDLFGKKHLTEKDLVKLVNAMKCLRFTYAGNYDFESSQVTFGGISSESLSSNLESKKEKGVYFVGEVLDADGLCGGFNLSFSLASSLEVASSI